MEWSHLLAAVSLVLLGAFLPDSDMRSYVSLLGTSLTFTGAQEIPSNIYEIVIIAAVPQLWNPLPRTAHLAPTLFFLEAFKINFYPIDCF